MVCGGDVWLSVIDIPGTTFHLSMLVCIINGIVRGSGKFHSGFYVVFAVISALDVLQVLMIYFSFRLNSCGYLPHLYEGNHWLGQVAYTGTTYVELYQFCGHTLISANRFTVLVLPPRFKWVWQGKPLLSLILLSLLVPIPLIANRFGIDVYYERANDGSYALAFMAQGTTFVSALICTSAAVVTSLISFLLEVFVVVKVRKHLISNKTSSDSFRNDVRLLISTLITFCAQLLLTAYYVTVLSSALSGNDGLHSFAQRQYIWICDVMSLSGSLALFAASAFVRAEYIRFYRLSKLPGVGLSRWTTSVAELSQEKWSRLR